MTVVDGASGATVVAAQSNSTFSIPAQSGHTYLVEQTSAPFTSLTMVNGDYVTADKAGGSALIANRTAVGGWEEFDLIND